MIKKITALCLSFIMLLGTLPAIAAEEITPVLNECYDEYAINETPAISFDAIDGRAVERQGLDKALYGKAWGGSDFSLSYPLSSTSTRMVFTADIKIAGARTSGNMLTVKTKSGTVNVLEFAENGRITLPSGRSIGGYRLGSWNKFAIAIDFENALMDVYVNGKQKENRFKFSYNKYAEPTELSFFASAPSGEGYSEIYLDNIIAYNADEYNPRLSFSKKAASSEVKEFTETTSVPQTGKLYSYYDFSDKLDFYFTPAGNTVDIVADEQKAENKVLHLLRDQNEKNVIAHFVAPTDMYNEKKFVVEYDIMLKQNGGTISMLEIVDQSSNLCGAAGLTGTTFYYNGRNAGSLSIGKWYNIAIAYNMVKKTANLYINDAKKLSDIPLHNGGAQPSMIRTRIESGSGNVEYYIDNMHAYSGDKLKEFTAEEIKAVANPDPILESEADAKELIGTASLFMTTNNTMYINGEKLFYDVEGYSPYIKGDSFMVPSSLIKKAFSQEQVTAGGDIPSEQKDGELYVSLKDYCEKVLKLVVSYDERGIYIVDNKEYPYTNSVVQSVVNEPADTVFRFMQYDRPDGEKIIADLFAYTPKGQHPRIITTPTEIEKIKGYIEKYDNYKTYLANAIKSADDIIPRTPVKQVFDNDGVSFLNSARTMMTRIRTLGIAYTFTGDEKYAERAWEEMENAMSWSHWNSDTYYYLDPSETTYGMVMGFDFFYDWLSKEQKDAIIDIVFERQLDTTANAYKGKHLRLHWVTGEITNWSFVCNGGAIAACIAFADEVDGERLEKIKFIMSQALQSIECTMMAFYPDGGWPEGPGYWQYSVMYLFGACIAPLKYGCGTTYDLMESPGLSTTLEHTIGLQSPNGMGFNYGDCAAGFTEKDSIGFLIALLNEDDALMQLWRRTVENLGSTGDERTLLWYRPSEGEETKESSLDKYFYSSEVGSMKESLTNPDAAYVAVKGGLTAHNSHSNLDAGNFVYDVLGLRWAEELGMEDYAIKSINYWTQHYWMYRTRPEGQNVVVINPREDNTDIGYYGGQLTKKYAPLIKEISKPRAAVMAFDLGEVYKEDVKAYKRGFMLGDDRQTLTIQDEIELLKDNSDIYWFMHTKAKIDISADGKSVILSNGDKKVKIEAVSNADEWVFEKMEVKPFPTSPQLPDQLVGAYEPRDINKLALKAKGSGKVNITVKLSPVVGYESFEAPKFIPIDEWQAPDGEIPAKPRAATIKANGVELDAFEQNRLTYKLEMPYGSPLPTISAEATIGTAAVTQCPAFGEAAKVTVSSDDGRVVTYTITVTMASEIVEGYIPGLKPTMGIPAGYKTLTPKAVSVCAVQEANNPGEHLIDGDLNTRWAIEGYDKWAEVDLGEAMDISGVALGTYEGKSRQNVFTLMVSEDGIRYTIVYDGKTSGLTSTDYDALMFNTKARYIRYVGNQNTKNTWNSVTEIAAIVKE